MLRYIPGLPFHYICSERPPTVCPELEELLPALSAEEFSVTEADILANGCHAPHGQSELSHRRWPQPLLHLPEARPALPHAGASSTACLNSSSIFQTQQGNRNQDKWENKIQKTRDLYEKDEQVNEEHKPVKDLRYDLMKHPAIHQSSLSGGAPAIHHSTPALRGQPLFLPGAQERRMSLEK